MTTYISILRGINVSGQNKIRMEELKCTYELLGFANVRTYIQSGNVVFESQGQNTTVLETMIEAKIELDFRSSISVFIRDAAYFQRILRSNPFINQRNEDPGKLYVTFLHRPPLESSIKELVVPPNETCEFYVGEQAIYLLCPNGYGKTKLSNALFEKKLNMPVTTRNWRTVNTLYEMAIRG